MWESHIICLWCLFPLRAGSEDDKKEGMLVYQSHPVSSGLPQERPPSGPLSSGSGDCRCQAVNPTRAGASLSGSLCASLVPRTAPGTW